MPVKLYTTCLCLCLFLGEVGRPTEKGGGLPSDMPWQDLHILLSQVKRWRDKGGRGMQVGEKSFV